MCNQAQCLKKHTKKSRRWPTLNIRTVTNASSINVRETQVSYGGNQIKGKKTKNPKKE